MYKAYTTTVFRHEDIDIPLVGVAAVFDADGLHDPLDSNFRAYK